MYTYEAIDVDACTSNVKLGFIIMEKNYIVGNYSCRSTGSCLLHHRDIPMQVRLPITVHNSAGFRLLVLFMTTQVKAKFKYLTKICLRPPQNFWKVTKERDPNCIDDTASLLAAGIINTLTDFIVVLLPIRTVWSISLPIKQTIPVILLFAFGFLSCFAGVARTYYTYQISQTWDKIWASYPIWVTAALELYIGIVSFHLPILHNKSNNWRKDLCLNTSNQTLLLHLPPSTL